MPSKNTTEKVVRQEAGLDLLVRKSSLTEADWVDLTEARRQLIKPHLSSFTLPTLGSLECLITVKDDGSSGPRHSIQDDTDTTTGDKRFSLKTQGLFEPCELCDGPWYFKEFGTREMWGLTRSGLWVLATINCVGKPYKTGNQRTETAMTVEIAEVPLSVLITKTRCEINKEDPDRPSRIWYELGETIQQLEKRRFKAYEEARKLSSIVAAEETAVSLM